MWVRRVCTAVCVEMFCRIVRSLQECGACQGGQTLCKGVEVCYV